MADIIDLNKVRKSRDKTVMDVRVKQNRVIYGQKKSEKKSAESRRAKQSKELDDHKLGDSEQT